MATHLEYITNQKFNSSFKNMLRDYYTYGFKDRSEYSVSRGTYDSDRKRLNDFLKGVEGRCKESGQLFAWKIALFFYGK